MRKNRFRMVVRGDARAQEIECVLRDVGGVRASRVCADAQEVGALLSGWIQAYRCNIHALFADALERVSPEIAGPLYEQLIECAPRKRFRTLSPEAVNNLLELAGYAYRPREIRELQKEIAGDTRAAAFRLENGGEMDPSNLNDIVEKKLDLDALCGQWAEGKIQ